MTPVPDSGFSFPPHEPQEPATALLGGATDLIEAFSLRMARHGMSVSRRMMLADPTYARQQAALFQINGGGHDQQHGHAYQQGAREAGHGAQRKLHPDGRRPHIKRAPHPPAKAQARVRQGIAQQHAA